MCAYLRSITWTTGCLWNRLQPVQIGPFALFEKHATATASLVLISLVQFGFWSFFGPMDWTFKYYSLIQHLFQLEGQMHQSMREECMMTWWPHMSQQIKFMLRNSPTSQHHLLHMWLPLFHLPKTHPLVLKLTLQCHRSQFLHGKLAMVRSGSGSAPLMPNLNPNLKTLKPKCYDFKRLRQSSTVVGTKVQVLTSLEECKS